MTDSHGERDGTPRATHKRSPAGPLGPSLPAHFVPIAPTGIGRSKVHKGRVPSLLGGDTHAMARRGDDGEKSLEQELRNYVDEPDQTD